MTIGKFLQQKGYSNVGEIIDKYFVTISGKRVDFLEEKVYPGDVVIVRTDDFMRVHKVV